MNISRLSIAGIHEAEKSGGDFLKSSICVKVSRAFLLASLILLGHPTNAQSSSPVNVVTAHNDNARDGQNLSETLLTPANVNTSKFGKLFSQTVSGNVYAQPLYVSQVTIPGQGLHNVVYVATDADYVYAFDADNNGGGNASPLWQTSLLSTLSQSYSSIYGVTGTPVIDLSSNTMYLVSSEQKTSTSYIDRLHALDITTGAEKFGGPVTIQGSVPGTGSGSSNGVLNFNALYQVQRAGLLLQNGVVYIAFGSYNDSGPWHGWLFSYATGTLDQLDIFCTTPNGSGGGIWMSGAGLAGEVNSQSKPYGRMFLATGNGAFNASSPYTSSMSYGMSVLDLDLSGGNFTVTDEFTPYDQASLDAQDGDLGSGGPILLPTQTLPSGKTVNPLIEIGKSGMVYLLDRNNLGGFNSSSDQVVQEVQTPQSGGTKNWGAGVWGTSAYWNNNLFFEGTDWGSSNGITAYSLTKGVLSTSPTSTGADHSFYPGATPSISANGTSNAIVWRLRTDKYSVGGPAVLFAYNANNMGTALYSSSSNLTRDNPGVAVHFGVPTVANGKVYVGADGQVSVFGLLGAAPTVATPVIYPGGGSFTGTQTVTITDATSGALIYYTTDGSTPTVNSNLYQGPFSISSTETISAIANAAGYLLGSVASANFVTASNTPNPVFSLASGTYAGTQSLTITAAKGAIIYYTFDGTTPTTSSPVYTGPLSVPVSETIQAIALVPQMGASSPTVAAYAITPAYGIDLSSGFTNVLALKQMQLNGSAAGLDDFRLQLTDGGTGEYSSAWYTQKMNVQAFTTDFVFQISNPSADGMTFAIQNSSVTARGGGGGNLGYGGIPTSLAIKFDIYNNAGEGPNSTGLYLNGASPTVPFLNLAGTNIDLHSGDLISTHITYDGVTLRMTLTDVTTQRAWPCSWIVNIPSVIGSNTAWVGFTAATGSSSASQKVMSWTYVPGPPAVPNYPSGLSAQQLSRTGATLSGRSLQMTTAGTNATTSAFFTTPVNIDAFTSDFYFQITQAGADGFAFVVQNAGPTALGTGGGGLGYATMPRSVAIKFDFFSNAGEGWDSTGVFTNGAMPTVPSINLSSSGVVLASGDVIHAHVNYDGTTLSWRLIDTTAPSKPSIENSTAINIPDTVGANTAYVGFTAAAGDGYSTQDILSWTFTNP